MLSRIISRLCHGLDIDEREIRRGLNLASPSAASGQGKKDPVASAAGFSKNALDREIIRFTLRYPHSLPALRDAGAMLLLSQPWALTLWEKIAASAPEYEPDSILRTLDNKEKELWARSRVMEAPPLEHQEEELADIVTLITKRCEEKQTSACMQALRQTGDKGDYDLDLLKALNETLIRQRTTGSSDG